MEEVNRVVVMQGSVHLAAVQVQILLEVAYLVTEELVDHTLQMAAAVLVILVGEAVLVTVLEGEAQVGLLGLLLPTYKETMEVTDTSL